MSTERRYPFLVKLELTEALAPGGDVEKLRRRLQLALDKAYPYARMGSARVVWVMEDRMPPPSSADTDG